MTFIVVGFVGSLYKHPRNWAGILGHSNKRIIR